MHGEGGVCMAGGMHGGGLCVVGGMHGRGYVWQGGHVWWGACIVGGVHGSGDLHGGGVHGRKNDNCSRQYAFYWNAFLFHCIISVYDFRKIINPAAGSATE